MVECAMGWSEKTFGNEDFWVKEFQGHQILLGRGPALGAGTSMARLRQLETTPNFPFGTLECAQQVHGSSIAVLATGPRKDPLGSAGLHDGLMTNSRGVGLVVWTADCVPVLISGGGAVAAVHAGWRGASAGILPKAVELFHRLFGVLASDLSATIGPAIGGCHYPVGPEVFSALNRLAVSDHMWRKEDTVDLRLYLHQQLSDLGVHGSSVEIVGPCTVCDSRLASFRRDGLAAGRQISMIGLTAS